MSKKVLEIINKMNAGEKANQSKTRKMLSEMGGLEIKNDPGKLLLDQAFAKAGSASMDLIKSSLTDILKVNQKNPIQAYINSPLQNISVKLNNTLSENSRINLPQKLIFLPTHEERIANELAESNRVNKEILEEMRNQRIEKNEQSDQDHFDFITVLGISRSDVYTHLFALCNNRKDLGITKFREQTEDDLDKIIISDLNAMGNGRTRGCVLGTVRILPAGSDTVMQFVRKDVFWHDPVINPALWKTFIQFTKEYFTRLQVDRNLISSNNEKTQSKLEVDPIWKTIIPNKGDDWEILRLWHKQYTNTEISNRLHKASRTITNRISTLRLRYPEANILTDKERRKQLQKS